jgi:hypothetical protein
MGEVIDARTRAFARAGLTKATGGPGSKSPSSCLPITQRHAAKRSAGCCFVHSPSSGAPIW